MRKAIWIPYLTMELGMVVAMDNNLPCLAGLLNNDKKRRKQDIPFDLLFKESVKSHVFYPFINCKGQLAGGADVRLREKTIINYSNDYV
jgi:hypothetical protein